MARLGEAIKNARKRAGLTQEELGKRAGLSAAYVSQVESGRRVDPQFSSVVKLCRALGLSMDAVASGTPLSPPNDATPSTSKLRRIAAQMRKALNDLEAELD